MFGLGFTFYPKDWWTSETFYALEPIERYFYLECIFLMYVEDGSIADDKGKVERRLGTTIKDGVWLKVSSMFIKTDDGRLTHRSVNNRIKISERNRINGAKGGAPIGNKNAVRNNPNNRKKQPTKQPKNKAKRIERESESESEKESKVELRETRAKNFYNSVAEYAQNYPKEMLRAFYNYWTEPNKSGTKMRFELEKTWDLSRRLERWAAKDKGFTKQENDTEKANIIERLKAKRRSYDA